VPRLGWRPARFRARRVTGAGDHGREPVDRLDADLFAELERHLAARVPDLSPQPHATESLSNFDHGGEDGDHAPREA
jgi:hypothetical protein